MYQNPVFFPAVTNRESWPQYVQILDEETDDPITLTDDNGDALYDIALEIKPAESKGMWTVGQPGPYYDNFNDPVISASLADYLSIIDTGAIFINIPKSKMNGLRPQTYDVFMTVTDTASDDGRQLFIGKLPVLYGGRNT